MGKIVVNAFTEPHYYVTSFCFLILQSIISDSSIVITGERDDGGRELHKLIVCQKDCESHTPTLNFPYLQHCQS